MAAEMIGVIGSNLNQHYKGVNEEVYNGKCPKMTYCLKP